MILYLGWIVAAFLAGVLLTQRRKPSLQQRVTRIGVFAGRTYAEILDTMDAPQAEVWHTDGRIVRTWRNCDYSISLLFDGRDMCLGVKSESNTKT